MSARKSPPDLLIEQALTNLILNAACAMGNAGILRFEAGRVAEHVHLRVADTGPGIPAEIQSAIFEPFATFGKAKGSGLGLAMAKKAVEDHGGTISLDSAPGTGTTFTITLPIGPGNENSAGTMEREKQHETTLA